MSIPHTTTRRRRSRRWTRSRDCGSSARHPAYPTYPGRAGSDCTSSLGLSSSNARCGARGRSGLSVVRRSAPGVTTRDRSIAWHRSPLNPVPGSWRLTWSGVVVSSRCRGDDRQGRLPVSDITAIAGVRQPAQGTRVGGAPASQLPRLPIVQRGPTKGTDRYSCPRNVAEVTLRASVECSRVRVGAVSGLFSRFAGEHPPFSEMLSLVTRHPQVTALLGRRVVDTTGREPVGDFLERHRLSVTAGMLLRRTGVKGLRRARYP